MEITCKRSIEDEGQYFLASRLHSLHKVFTEDYILFFKSYILPFDDECRDSNDNYDGQNFITLKNAVRQIQRKIMNLVITVNYVNDLLHWSTCRITT